MSPLSTVSILDIPIYRGDLNDLMLEMVEIIESKQKKQIAVTPVNNLVWASKNKPLKKIYQEVHLCTADGVPLLWAAKFLGKPIKGRTTGYEILPKFAEIAAEKNYSFFLLGGAESVAEKAKQNLETKFPGLTIVGCYSPPFKNKFTDDENQKMIVRINESKANVLWVAMTAPKQDFWIQEILSSIHVNIAIGIGASLDVQAGLFKRPPIWIQKNGFEWLYRLMQEPKRLFRRYLIEAPRFIPLLIKQKITGK